MRIPVRNKLLTSMPKNRYSTEVICRAKSHSALLVVIVFECHNSQVAAG